MKVSQHISEAKRTLFSLEVLPPLKGQRIDSIYDTMDKLMKFEPAFVDVTYHREEYVFRNAGGGLLKKHIVRKRPGTVGICAALMHKYNVDPVPHLICGGFTKGETENALIDLHFLGIDNMLVLRGDPIKSESSFKAEPDGHAYASELLGQVTDLNKGIYLDPDLKNPTQTNFCPGVAGYPEKHFESPNLNTDLKYLKHKVDLGAEYIVTQLFYDNKAYFDFVLRCRQVGINVPIIPGLKPLSLSKHLHVLPQFFNVDLPQELVERVEAASDPQEVREIGIDWCIAQSKELKDAGVPALHYYTMGNSDNIETVVSAVM